MTAPARAALYLRVSTGRQADNDLSIPDQRRQAESGRCQKEEQGRAQAHRISVAAVPLSAAKLADCPAAIV